MAISHGGFGEVGVKNLAYPGFYQPMGAFVLDRGFLDAGFMAP